MTSQTESSDSFRTFYMNQPASERRCEVRSIDGQCPNKALYLLRWDDREGAVCRSCLAGWVDTLIASRDHVAVSRLSAPTKVTWW